MLPDWGRLASVDPTIITFCQPRLRNRKSRSGGSSIRAPRERDFDAAAGGIRLDLEQAPPARGPFFDAIPRRQSTRSIFDGQAIPAEHLRLLEAAGSDDGVTLRLFTERKPIEDILGYLIAGNSAQMDDWRSSPS